MKKKMLSLALAAVMALSLAACNTTKPPPADPVTPAAPVAPADPVTPADPAEPSGGVVRDRIPDVIRWGSASTGSAGYVIITAFSDLISKYVTDFRSSSMSTSGGAENVTLLAGGEIDFGQVTSSDFVKALAGLEPYSEPIDIYQAIGYRTNANMIHVLKKSGITSVEQLDGKKVAVGSASGSGRTMVQPGLLALGITPEFVYGSWDECAEMLKSEQVSAVVFPIIGGTDPTSAVIQLNTTADITVVPLSKEQAQTMCDAAKGVSVVEVPADYLGLGTPAFYAQGYHNSLGVRPGVNEEVVYTVVKTLLEHEAELHEVSNDLHLFAKENAFKFMLPEVPIHPGAAKLYKELGIWDDAYTVGD